MAIAFRESVWRSASERARATSGMQTTTATSSSLNAPAASASTSVGSPAPLELEQTLSLLSSHRSVLGYLVLSRAAPVSIIRHSGVVFEGEQGRKYARAVARIVEAVTEGLEEVGGEGERVSVSMTFVERKWLTVDAGRG